MAAVEYVSTGRSKDAVFKHWHLMRDRDDLAWLIIDRAGESTNTLGEEVIAELDDIVAALEKDPPKGLVLKSAKANGFIAGADIREFEHFTRAEDVAAKVREGHAVFARLEALKCPKVAAVAGFCLGGGLELALCCDYIIAEDREDTRIGLPEVNLGIFPGLGGTVRLTDRIGGLKGLELMLTGRLLRARVARGLGVIDQVIGRHESLRWAARRAVLQKRRRRGPDWLGRLSNTAPARQILAEVMTRRTRQKARPEQYPAPYRLIELWREHRGNRAAMFEAEATGIGDMMVTPTATNLRRVFKLMERLKGLGKQADFPVRRVHVIGAGVMGGDIAAWCVVQGMEVTLQDREMKYIEPAMTRAKALFKRRLKTRPAITAATARLIPDVDGKGVVRADVIIEAIFEDIEAKQALFKSLEPRMKDTAILASNTSAIPLETLASVLENPGRLIGLHFFNPVAKMPLVEVIRGEQTDDEIVSRGSTFCGLINRFPVPVKSSPGFLVNRVLAPYLMEAVRCLNEGIGKQTIDAAATRFGMPMGPIELADVVGLDVCVKVAETLASGDVEKERKLLEGMIADGTLGKKTGQGFYEWKKGRAVKDGQVDAAINPGVLADRLLKTFLDECVACRADEIVADDDLLDAGIIFGTGFAPFRGGPLHYLQTLANKPANGKQT